MKGKYTKGPWTLFDNGHYVHVMGADHCRVTILDDCHLDAESKANAALISAAPDLLQALKSMVQRFGGSAICFFDHVAINKAREAIAKAEGTPEHDTYDGPD